MKVTLSYSLIIIEDAPLWLDTIGRYRLRVRKTPEDMREERMNNAKYGNTRKINPYRFEERSVMERDPSNPGTLCFMAGLWPRVKSMLDKQGLSYEIEDCRDPAKKPPIDIEAIQGIELRENQDVAIALLATADCGIINTPTGFGKSFIISVLCKAFPTLNIVVTTSSASVVATNYEYLNKIIPGQVGSLTGKGDTTKGKRVIVTTLKSLAKIPAEHVDLLLCDECHDVGATQAAEVISGFYFARKFGFSASPVRTDGSAIVMESLFGPTILNMSYTEAVDAGMVTPMKYVMLPCGWCPSILKSGKDMMDVTLKRYSYWVNSARNKAIRDFMYQLKNSSDAQVLIMVQTLDHALQLKALMPWLVVAYYGSADMAELRRKYPKTKYPQLDLDKVKMNQRQLDITRRAFAKGTLRWVVSTYVFRQGVSFSHLRVLIRADGATSAIAGIQIPGRLSRLDEGKDCAYLVDFNDTFTPWAARRSETRAKLYQEQGWKEITREELLNDLRTKPDTELDDVAGSSSTEA